MSGQIHHNRLFIPFAAALLASGFTDRNASAAGPDAGGPQIVSVQKIWDQAPHNAFTDLIRFHDKWYCTFRESDAHVGGNGKIRILESAAGEHWEPVGLVEEAGIDLRDGKLSIMPDGRLMLVAGGSVYRGTKLLGRQPRVAFSADARTWTPPRRILSEGEWLWRVTWHEGRAYGVSYNQHPRDPLPAKPDAAPLGRPDWQVSLFTTTDGVNYDLVTRLDVPGCPNEATVRFLPDGQMLALVRRDAGNKHGWIGTSRPPYREWTWHETAHSFGGPNFIILPDGSMWAASREKNKTGSKTVLARLGLDTYEPVLTLPSGGDTSYAGLVWHDGLLWMSYYSSHEGKASIYLAKIKLTP